jgi:hypothetical protein
MSPLSPLVSIAPPLITSAASSRSTKRVLFTPVAPLPVPATPDAIESAEAAERVRLQAERTRRFASRPNAPAALIAGMGAFGELPRTASRFFLSANRKQGWYQAPVVTDGRAGFELRVVFIVAPSIDGLSDALSFWRYLTIFCARDNSHFQNIWPIAEITKFQEGHNYLALPTSSLILRQVGPLPSKQRGSSPHRDFFRRLDDFVKPCSSICSQCRSGHILISIGLEIYPDEHGKEEVALIRSIVAQHAHHTVATHPHDVTTT